MDPRKKDGVRAHPFVLVTGVVFHVAIAAALGSLLALGLGADVPRPLRIVMASAQAAGVFAGLLLQVRRLREPVLQAISVADDYVSNLLVLIFLITAASSLIVPRWSPLFVLASAALALYAPFGKIRHCVLFFVTRARFGAFVGSRSLFEHRSHE